MILPDLHHVGMKVAHLVQYAALALNYGIAQTHVAPTVDANLTATESARDVVIVAVSPSSRLSAA